MYGDAIEILQQPTGVLQRLQQLVDLIVRQEDYDWAGVYVPSADDDGSLLLGARAGRRGARRRVAVSECPATATVQPADSTTEQEPAVSHIWLPLGAGGAGLGVLVVRALGEGPERHFPLLQGVAEELSAMLALRR